MPRLGHADLALSACQLIAALADANSVALFARRPGPPGSPRLCALLPSSSRRRPGPFATAAAALSDSDEEVDSCDGSSDGGARSGGSAHVTARTVGSADDLMVVDLDTARTRSLMEAASVAGARGVLAANASTAVAGKGGQDAEVSCGDSVL